MLLPGSKSESGSFPCTGTGTAVHPTLSRTRNRSVDQSESQCKTSLLFISDYKKQEEENDFHRVFQNCQKLVWNGF